jgi:DHA2 family multidrug resistance protein
MNVGPDRDPHRPAPALVALAVLLPTTLIGLSAFTVSVALEHIRGAFSSAPDEVTWAVSSHIVAYTLMLPVSGWLASRLGERRLFLLGTVLFTAGSAAAGAAPTLPLFVLARVAQGLAGGALVPASQTVVLRAFPSGPRRGMALAVWALAVASGSIAGPTVGGLITEHLGWKWVFHANVPLGLLALPLLHLAVADRPGGSAPPLDLGGLLLLAAGVSTLQTVLERGEREDWSRSPFIVALALVSAVTLALFVRRCLRAPHPLVSLAVLRNRGFALGSLLMALVAACQSAAVILSTVYAVRVMDYDALAAGMALAPAGLATALTMTLAGALGDRLGPRWLIGAGAVVAALGMYGMSGLTLSASFTDLAWPRLLFGLGLGLLLAALTGLTISHVATAQLPAAAGLSNLLRNIGASVGIALTRSYLDRASQTHQARLVERLEPLRAAAGARLEALRAELLWQGSDPASADRQVWAHLYATVRKQALFLSFLETYRVLVVLLVLTVPALLLLPAARRRT